jgi:hypothetical protein
MASQTASLLLINGRVRTMDPAAAGDAERGTHGALAVQGDRILALGPTRDLLALQGPRTRVVDLRGRTVLPGFTDAHTHPATSGMSQLQCSLHRYDSIPEHLAAIVRYAAANPDREWIVGDGWSMETFPGGIPTKAPLDAILPDRPVYIENRDGHGAWVNSAALARAGIDRDTPDPAGGRIERDEHGEPIGMLQESAAALVERLLPAEPPERWEEAILLAQSQLHALGIVGWQDANLRPSGDAYARLARAGKLTARVVGSQLWGGNGGTTDVEAMVERRARETVGRFSASSVKFFTDGVLETFTGAVLEPYRDAAGAATTNHGMLMFEPEELADAAVRLDARGFQLHYHAIGDRAVRSALDAIEAARRANGPSDGRHHIAHIQIIQPDDVRRFARLGAVANGQPYWACHEDQMDILTIPFLAPDAVGWQYPFASLLRAGARLAFGSDWSVSTPDPLVEIEVAVNRAIDLHREAEPFLPDERISLEAAVAAFTTGSAYVNHVDDGGWLGVGRLADLIVLDRDLFAPDTGPIGDARVVATFVGGQPVFERADFELG